MSTPDAVDQSWAYLDPGTARQLGIKLVSGYLSHDPSKNWTAAKIRAYHAAGIGVLLNWEAEAGAPLLGQSAGQQDAAAWLELYEQLVAGVGYSPAMKIAAVFSCDRDVNPAQYPAIDAYYRAAGAVLGGRFLVGVYGEADLVDHLHDAGLTQAQWQTLAWSGGRVSAVAGLYQYSIDRVLGGASVDLDQIRDAAHIGAWWPPGHPLNKPPAAPAGGDQEDDMLCIKFINSAPANPNAVYLVSGGVLLYLSPADYGWLGKPKVKAVDKRSVFWRLPVAAGTPDFRNK